MGIGFIGLMKAILAILFYRLNLWPLFFAVYRLLRGRPVLVVFTFHRIVPEEPDSRHLQGYERGTRQSIYETQIDLIRRYFDVIHLDRFNRLVGDDPGPATKRPMALLTFDDVDSDHPARAFSRLRKDGLPGVAFVPTGFIETDRRFYHLRLTNLCNLLTSQDWADILEGEMPTEVRSTVESHLSLGRQSLRDFRRALIGPFEKMQPDDRDGLIDRWERHIDGRYELGIGCMSWSEIIDLPKHGIAVGSHTANHNRLVLLDDAGLSFELTESKRVLEQKLGQAVTSICYPEGSFDNRVPAACRQANYDLGFTSNGYPVNYPLRGDDLYLIPRIDLIDGPAERIAWSLGIRIMKSLWRSP